MQADDRIDDRAFVDRAGERQVVSTERGDARSASRPTLPSANSWRVRAFSLFGMPEDIGPPGTKIVGR